MILSKIIFRVSQCGKQEIIRQLPERERSIFMKSRIEGKSSRVIAFELGLSPGTVDNYISKTLKMINEKLAGEV